MPLYAGVLGLVPLTASRVAPPPAGRGGGGGRPPPISRSFCKCRTKSSNKFWINCYRIPMSTLRKVRACCWLLIVHLLELIYCKLPVYVSGLAPCSFLTAIQSMQSSRKSGMFYLLLRLVSNWFPSGAFDMGALGTAVNSIKFWLLLDMSDKQLQIVGVSSITS